MPLRTDNIPVLRPRGAGGELCPGFFTMTLLRPPLERMVSNSLELAKWGMVVPPKQGYCRNYSHMRRLSPIVFDNYYIRVLLGGDVMRLPTGALNDEHRRQAERVLRQMDLVLLSNAAATPTALQNATGIVNYTACRAPRPSACQMTAEDEERALRDNALDLELYRFAEALSAEHVARYAGGAMIAEASTFSPVSS